MCAYNRRQRAVRVRERAPARPTCSAATGAFAATCWPTTARRSNTARARCTTGSTSIRGPAIGVLARRGRTPRSRRGWRASRTSTSTCAASCGRCSPTGSSTATPTAYDDVPIDKQGHAGAARADRGAGHRAAEERRRAAARPGGGRLDRGDRRRGRRACPRRRLLARSRAQVLVTPRAGIEAPRPGAASRCASTPARTGRAAALARRADVAVVVVADATTEGADKPCMGLNCGATAASTATR